MSGGFDVFYCKFNFVDQTLQVFAFYNALSAYGTSDFEQLNPAKSLILYLYIYYTTKYNKIEEYNKYNIYSICI